MDGNTIMKSLGGMEVYDEACRKHINGVLTAGSGSAYTATVKAISGLAVGANFVMVPNVTSTTTTPTLNVNGFGAKTIKIRTSNSTASPMPLPSANFLSSVQPVHVVYDGQNWVIDDVVQPSASGLVGTVPVSSGGTGGTTVAQARNNLGLGNTAGALPIANGGTGGTTVAQARNNLGLGNTSGALPVANGGTGGTTASQARTNLGITPANIGASATSHKHDAADVTTGALPIAHGGTGAADAKTALNNLGITWGTDRAEDSGAPNTIYIQLLD
jgi:hypothetical protein